MERVMVLETDISSCKREIKVYIDECGFRVPRGFREGCGLREQCTSDVRMKASLLFAVVWIRERARMDDG
jgi:hypothetical protein